MFQVYAPNISVPDECCKCFCLDDAKVDLDVVYTCMLQAYVSSVCRCFIRMFAKVDLDVAYVCNVFKCFSTVFSSSSDVHLSSFLCCNCYIWMFQK
jgi:hypothetical protein